MGKKTNYTVDIPLGQAPEVFQLFSYANPALALTDVISHGLNQTLQRDMYWGSWADAYIHDNGEYRVKITSPTHDVSVYKKLITNYLKAGRIAMDTYNSKGIRGTDFQFQLPFGMAMANVRSVQLFHFPPIETFYYTDYLYSPTNRRWECLLAQNGFDGRDNTLVERIVDVVPIAAPGGAMKALEPFDQMFHAYGKKQLSNFLDASGKVTQPVVAYGSPVREWLWEVYGSQIKRQLDTKGSDNPLEVMSLIELDIVRGAKTPILCANHPSMYLYDTDIPVNDPPKDSEYPPPLDIMRDDLIAAGWQAAMSKKWDKNPKTTLAAMKKRWASDAKVKRIMKEQNAEFSYSK
jgi:hypothetical protein